MNTTDKSLSLRLLVYVKGINNEIWQVFTKQMLEHSIKKVREQAIQTKNIPGRGHSKCKGPEASTCSECLNKRKEANANRMERKRMRATEECVCMCVGCREQIKYGLVSYAQDFSFFPVRGF